MKSIKSKPQLEQIYKSDLQFVSTYNRNKRKEKEQWSKTILLLMNGNERDIQKKLQEISSTIEQKTKKIIETKEDIESNINKRVSPILPWKVINKELTYFVGIISFENIIERCIYMESNYDYFRKTFKELQECLENLNKVNQFEIAISSLSVEMYCIISIIKNKECVVQSGIRVDNVEMMKHK